MNLSYRARPGTPAQAQGPAFAAHRVAMYLALAAVLIDQLIR